MISKQTVSQHDPVTANKAKLNSANARISNNRDQEHLSVGKQEKQKAMNLFTNNITRFSGTPTHAKPEAKNFFKMELSAAFKETSCNPNNSWSDITCHGESKGAADLGVSFSKRQQLQQTENYVPRLSFMLHDFMWQLHFIWKKTKCINTQVWIFVYAKCCIFSTRLLNHIQSPLLTPFYGKDRSCLASSMRAKVSNIM